jgi:hypothetical protein
MKMKIIITTILLCCFIFLFAMNPNIAGKWIGIAKITGQEDITLNFTLKTDNNKLTGAATSSDADGAEHVYDLLDGVLNGDSLSFTVVVENGSKVLNKGKYYAKEDSISINCSLVETGENIGLISLKRNGSNK